LGASRGLAGKGEQAAQAADELFPDWASRAGRATAGNSGPANELLFGAFE